MEFDLDGFDDEIISHTAALLKARFPMIIDAYLEDAQIYIKSIKKGFNDNNLGVVSQNAHPLKSSSQAVGVLSIYNIAKFLEDEAKAAMVNGGNIDQHKNLLPMLDDAYEIAKPKLMSCINR